MRNASILGTCFIFVALVTAAPAVAEDAAAIVERMVAAHGGMEAWKNAPSVSFTDGWQTPGSPMVMESNIIVEQGARRSLMEYPAFGATIGWDGEHAWSHNWAMPMPPRFLVGLTYYFTNLAWLVKDPGVVLGEPGTVKLRDDPTGYISIRVTYEAGVGDTPDDYYVLFIHPETYELHGCEYVVTYPGLVPEGMAHTPPHILVYGPLVTVDGLKVPARFDVYEEDYREYATCTLTNWSFVKPFDPALVAMPEGAVVDESMSNAGTTE
jgi:hypothetical protein